MTDQIYNRYVNAVTRRQMLKLTGGALGALVLSACAGETLTSTTVARGATTAPVGATTTVPPATSSTLSAEELMVDVTHGFPWAGRPGSMAEYWAELQNRLADGSNGAIIRDLFETDERSILPTIQAADAARSGPVLVTYFSGWNTYQFLAKDTLEPLDDYVGGTAETDNWIGTNVYDGNHYMAPFLSASALLFANRAHLAASGIEVDDRFESWDDFIAAARAVGDSGVQPITFGASDGLAQDKWTQACVLEVVDNFAAIPRIATGDTPVTDPVASIWADRLAQIVDEGLINNDAAALTEQQSIQQFLDGEAGFILTYPGAILSADNAEDFEILGLWGGPGPADAPILVAGSGLQMKNYGENFQAAGNLIAFQHQPEQLTLFNELTGELPADKRFDSSALDAQTQRTFDFIKGELIPDAPPPVWLHENVSGTQLVATWDASRLVIEGGSPDEARQLLDERLQEYRTQNEPEVTVLAEYADSLEA